MYSLSESKYQKTVPNLALINALAESEKNSINLSTFFPLNNDDTSNSTTHLTIKSIANGGSINKEMNSDVLHINVKGGSLVMKENDDKILNEGIELDPVKVKEKESKIDSGVNKVLIEEKEIVRSKRPTALDVIEEIASVKEKTSPVATPTPTSTTIQRSRLPPPPPPILASLPSISTSSSVVPSITSESSISNIPTPLIERRSRLPPSLIRIDKVLNSSITPDKLPESFSIPSPKLSRLPPNPSHPVVNQGTPPIISRLPTFAPTNTSISTPTSIPKKSRLPSSSTPQPSSLNPVVSRLPPSSTPNASTSRLPTSNLSRLPSNPITVEPTLPTASTSRLPPTSSSTANPSRLPQSSTAQSSIPIPSRLPQLNSNLSSTPTFSRLPTYSTVSSSSIPLSSSIPIAPISRLPPVSSALISNHIPMERTIQYNSQYSQVESVEPIKVFSANLKNLINDVSRLRSLSPKTQPNSRPAIHPIASISPSPPDTSQSFSRYQFDRSDHNTNKESLPLPSPRITPQEPEIENDKVEESSSNSNRFKTRSIIWNLPAHGTFFPTLAAFHSAVVEASFKSSGINFHFLGDGSQHVTLRCNKSHEKCKARIAVKFDKLRSGWIVDGEWNITTHSHGIAKELEMNPLWRPFVLGPKDLEEREIKERKRLGEKLVGGDGNVLTVSDNGNGVDEISIVRSASVLEMPKVGEIYPSRHALMSAASYGSHLLGYKFVITKSPGQTGFFSQGCPKSVFPTPMNKRCFAGLTAELLEVGKTSWKVTSISTVHNHSKEKQGAWRPTKVPLEESDGTSIKKRSKSRSSIGSDMDISEGDEADVTFMSSEEESNSSSNDSDSDSGRIRRKKINQSKGKQGLSSSRTSFSSTATTSTRKSSTGNIPTTSTEKYNSPRLSLKRSSSSDVLPAPKNRRLSDLIPTPSTPSFNFPPLPSQYGSKLLEGGINSNYALSNLIGLSDIESENYFERIDIPGLQRKLIMKKFKDMRISLGGS